LYSSAARFPNISERHISAWEQACADEVISDNADQYAGVRGGPYKRYLQKSEMIGILL